MGWGDNCFDVWVLCCIHTVVGGVVYCTNDIYGGRTSLFLSSQRMPAATSSNCEMIQLYEYIIVDKMAYAIFDYIFYIHIVDCMLL